MEYQKENKIELVTGLALMHKGIDLETRQEVFKNFNTFLLDGTEEEIFNKLNFQLCSIFACFYTNNWETGDIQKEIEKVMKRNKVNYPHKFKKIQ